MDQRIREMREQVQQKNSLKVKLQELQRQKNVLKEDLRELEYRKQKEEADVARLEQDGLRSFFYQILGRKEEQLDREKQEAYVAAAKYETARQQLDSVQKDIKDLERTLAETSDIETQLEAMLQEKKEQLKSSGDAKGMQIMEKEERIAWLRNQEKEIWEAISAGSSAVHMAEQILSELDSAHGWGVYDVIGGGLVADLVKHSHLDNAQAQIDELQTQLAKFKKEMADVSMDEQLRVQISGFLKFADFFWDGLFSDILVMNKIDESRNQMNTCMNDLNRAMNRLDNMQKDTRRQIEAAENAIRTLVENS